MSKPMMKCGHTAQGITQMDEHVCVICGCMEVETDPINISERMARCGECGRMTASNLSLPFFHHIPEMKYDSYYCGCRGWN